MEQRAKDETQKEFTQRSENESGAQSEDILANTSQGKTAPADRDAGSLEHGELGGNFNEQAEEEGS